MTNPSGVSTPTVSIGITATSAAGGGAIRFRRGTTGAFYNGLTLQVPTNGASVPFFVDGRFGQPSVNNGDVTIEATGSLDLKGTNVKLVGQAMAEVSASGPTTIKGSLVRIN